MALAGIGAVAAGILFSMYYFKEWKGGEGVSQGVKDAIDEVTKHLDERLTCLAKNYPEGTKKLTRVKDELSNLHNAKSADEIETSMEAFRKSMHLFAAESQTLDDSVKCSTANLDKAYQELSMTLWKEQLEALKNLCADGRNDVINLLVSDNNGQILQGLKDTLSKTQHNRMLRDKTQMAIEEAERAIESATKESEAKESEASEKTLALLAEFRKHSSMRLSNCKVMSANFKE